MKCQCKGPCTLDDEQLVVPRKWKILRLKIYKTRVVFAPSVEGQIREGLFFLTRVSSSPPEGKVRLAYVQAMRSHK